jgi:hypothetical protein
LFRNVGSGAIKDPYTPPKAWSDLKQVVPETWQHYDFKGVDFNKQVQEAQLPVYNALPKNEFLSEKKLETLGVPVTYAGCRSTMPQQSKDARVAVQGKAKASSIKAPFATA